MTKVTADAWITVNQQMQGLLQALASTSLECGALSPLWPVAAWRDHAELESTYDCGAKPPAKAPTTGVPSAAAALGWRGGALHGVAHYDAWFTWLYAPSTKLFG